MNSLLRQFLVLRPVSNTLNFLAKSRTTINSGYSWIIGNGELRESKRATQDFKTLHSSQNHFLHIIITISITVNFKFIP